MKLSPKAFWIRTGGGIALAAASAVLLTLSFPPHGLWPLIWIGFAPMLVAQFRVLPPNISSLALFRSPTTATVRVAALHYDAGVPWSGVERFMQLTREAAEEGAQVIVWPEMAIEGDPQVVNTADFRQLAAQTDAYLALGYFVPVDERV